MVYTRLFGIGITSVVKDVEIAALTTQCKDMPRIVWLRITIGDGLTRDRLTVRAETDSNGNVLIGAPFGFVQSLGDVLSQLVTGCTLLGIAVSYDAAYKEGQNGSE